MRLRETRGLVGLVLILVAASACQHADATPAGAEQKLTELKRRQQELLGIAEEDLRVGMTPGEVEATRLGKPDGDKWYSNWSDGCKLTWNYGSYGDFRLFRSLLCVRFKNGGVHDWLLGSVEDEPRQERVPLTDAEMQSNLKAIEDLIRELETESNRL